MAHKAKTQHQLDGWDLSVPLPTIGMTEGPGQMPIDGIRWNVEWLSSTSSAIVNVHVDRTLAKDSARSIIETFSPRAVWQYFADNILENECFIKLLLPTQSGYIVQSDFLERRMIDCLNVKQARGFVAPGQYIQGQSIDVYVSMGLLDLVSCCYGAIVVNPTPDGEVHSAAINDELVRRLSYSWLSKKPIPRRRLAFVGAAPLCKFEGYARAAASMNVALVVLDVPEQAVPLEKYAHLIEEFVPTDMTADTNLIQRLANTLSQMQDQGKRFDGIMSVDEHLLQVIAHAATLLHLPTQSPRAITLAQNKFKTRQLVTRDSYSHLVRSPADLEALLARDGPPPPFPLIVKPCKGWSSEGVWKVCDEAELRTRVHALWQDLFTDWHGHEVVIEKYVDGPEVDANMALVNGEVVFFEANDDFPSSADCVRADDVAARPATFVETSNMIPSALPADERRILQERLHEIALAVGFRDGVLHMEARLSNSRSRFAEVKDAEVEGILDLEPRLEVTPAMTRDDIFLIEINPRPPGWQEVEATAHAYGVSYYSLAIANAIGDRDRFTALSEPFKGGAQYHMQLLFVPALRGGIYSFGEIAATVMNQAEHLREHVVKNVTLMQQGQEVPDPRTGKVYGSFIAFFLVISRTSRLEALKIGHEIEQLVRVHTEGF